MTQPPLIVIQKEHAINAIKNHRNKLQDQLMTKDRECCELRKAIFEIDNVIDAVDRVKSPT